MSGFWLAAALLLALSVAALLVPLLRRPTVVSTGREAALATYRARLAEIDEDRARGVLDEVASRQARAEIEAALAQDLAEREAEVAPAPSTGRAWVAAALALVLVPALALGLYLRIGEHEQAAAEREQTRLQAEQRASMEALVQRLEARLRTKPGEGEGWWLLGRSWLSLGEADKAARALGQAWVLGEGQAELALDYAEALARLQGDKLAGAPARLIAGALESEPENPRALWLGAMEAQERGAREEARARLETLASGLEPGSPDARLVEAQLAGLGQGQPAATEAGAGQAGSAAAGPAGEAAARIQVRVELDPALAAEARPEDTVFVFARALEGPPMPLAVARTQVKDLPMTVTLDDTMAMVPEMSLSRFAQVSVGARVSRSGQATPASGDLQGYAEAPVATASPPAEPVRVVMRERVP